MFTKSSYNVRESAITGIGISPLLAGLNRKHRIQEDRVDHAQHHGPEHQMIFLLCSESPFGWIDIRDVVDGLSDLVRHAMTEDAEKPGIPADSVGLGGDCLAVAPPPCTNRSRSTVGTTVIGMSLRDSQILRTTFLNLLSVLIHPTRCRRLFRADLVGFGVHLAVYKPNVAETK